ncbi:MAG: methyl-accepting chemotaxis protein [Bdellovibrionota bacterium]
MDNRRKIVNYFIEPGFQVRYLAFLIGSSFIPILVTAAIISYFLRQNYLLLVNYAALDPDITSLLMWELKFLIAIIGVTFFCFFAAITVLGIVFSHRIAGVIYKTRKTCKEISSGSEIELKFRDKDEFQDLADDFNAMLKTLRNKSGAVRAS